MDINQAVAALAGRGIGVKVSLTPAQKLANVQLRMRTATVAEATASAGGFKGAVLSGTTSSEGRDLALACLDLCLERISILQAEDTVG